MLDQVRYGVRRFMGKGAVALMLALSGPAQADTVEILALGDSLTQGYGLVERDGFVPQLQAWLAARGHDVTIVNGGVSGDTSSGGFARVEWSLTDETDAMIVTLGGNDLLRGTAPEVTRKNIEGILRVAEDRGLEVLLIGLPVPGNYGAEYKRSFDAIYPELSEKYGALYLESFFAGLGGPEASPVDLARFMQPDGIHPNAEGVIRIVETIGPLVEELIKRSELPTN